MKAFITSFILVLCCCTHSIYAQNYLSQSFDGTAFPPTGWSNVFVRGVRVSPVDTVWYRTISFGTYYAPATHSGSGMAAYDCYQLVNGSEALLITPPINLTSYTTGSNRIFFWFYRMATHILGFHGAEADTLNVWVNTASSLSGAVKLGTYINGINNEPVVSDSGWYRYVVNIPDSFMSSNHLYVLFDGVSDWAVKLFLDDVSVDHIPLCSGVPNVSLKPGPTYIPICIGGMFTLSGNGDYNVIGQKYQWQTAASVAGPWTDVSGATDTIYTTNAAFSGTAYFRLKDSCTGSGNVAYSLLDTVAQVPPVYASIPYEQDFESWQNYCNVLDVPGSSWHNIPAVGLGSWRRDDQGCAYGGWLDTGCNMYPVNSLGGNNYISGAHCARFHSSGVLSSKASPWEAALELYVNCSGTGNKLLQFYFKNQGSYDEPYVAYNNDSLCVYMSTDGGATFSKIWGADTAQDWKRTQVQLASSSATTIIRFLGKRNGGDPLGLGESADLSDIGLDSVYIGPACSGLASAGAIVPSGNVNECAAGSYYLNIAGVPLSGGITYQWQKAVAPFSSFTDISGATDIRYTTPVLFDTVQYRVKVTCPYVAPATVLTSAVTTLRIKPVNYASLNTTGLGSGYHYSFENWSSRCAVYDAPVIATGSSVSNWANYPATGDNSWRREDEGTSAGWPYYETTPPIGYSPVAYDSSHSARFYTYSHYGSPRSPGNLYLFIDCSADTNTKELLYNTNIGAAPTGFVSDTLASWLSTDGGNTFSLLQKDYNGNGTWHQAMLTLPSNSAKTVIRFQGIYGDLNNSNTSGIGIDNVKILLKCNSKPTAGLLQSDATCAGDTVAIKLQGESEATGLYYIWQQSTDSTVWTNIASHAAASITESFTAKTYLRAIAVCSNTMQTDTSNTAMFSIKPFYKCYCNPVANVTSYYYGEGSIGDVIVQKQSGDTVMNHVTSNNVLYNYWAARVCYGDLAVLNGYIDCRDTIPPINLYIDSNYKLSVEEVSPSSYFSSGYPVNTYIDYNHNAAFDSAELVFNKSVTSAAYPVVTDTFTIPHNTPTGLTGMRILLGLYYSSPLNPCTRTANYGEIRDYLVNIAYAPCNGPVFAGRSISANTALCFGERFVIIDNSHDNKRPGTTWNWLTSTDRINWQNVPLTVRKDTLTEIFDTAAWYRLQMVCVATHDTTYSNNTEIIPDSTYRCYCYSAAIGNAQDSSDIDFFSFGPYSVNKMATGLLNVAATNGHERFDDSVLDLYVDTTYHAVVSPTYRTTVGGYAKVTLFIDYNNNLKYDIPQEHLWTAYTSAALWDVATDIKIPDSVISDVPTGMRLILNNDVKSSKASDDACGEYTSGETMDFIVRFNRAWTTGVGNIDNFQKLSMYPNPTDGKFTISFVSKSNIKDLQMSVSNMTGQQVYSHSYTNLNGEFKTEIDLGGVARGVYFVTFMADGERMIRKMVIK